MCVSGPTGFVLHRSGGGYVYSNRVAAGVRTLVRHDTCYCGACTAVGPMDPLPCR